MLKHYVIIAGIPRSGTTFVFIHVARFSQKIGNKPLQVLKTHGLAPPDCMYDNQWMQTEYVIKQPGTKALFVFGNPIHSVISTRVAVFQGHHAENCGFFGDLGLINLYRQDAFNYEKMFDSWMKPHPYPVLSIRYEALPRVQHHINDFLNCSIKWSRFNQRKTTYKSVNANNLENIKRTYSSLIEKVKNAPDYKFWEVL